MTTRGSAGIIEESSSYYGKTHMSDPAGNPSKIPLLEARLGCSWASIAKAREDTQQRRRELERHFLGRNSPDTSLVVFGSVAREEVTSGSDLDWVLLIDGQSVPEHKEQEREIERILAAEHFIEPGRSSVFGKMVGSHDLVHHIGGEDDLNSNTTRRVLLLLESAIGKPTTAFGVRSCVDTWRTIGGLPMERRYSHPTAPSK